MTIRTKQALAAVLALSALLVLPVRESAPSERRHRNRLRIEHR